MEKHTTWVFSINKDDEQLLSQAKQDTGLSADYRESAGSAFNEPLLTVWCEDDETGCALMHRFLELRGEIAVSYIDYVEEFTRRRLREVL